MAKVQFIRTRDGSDLAVLSRADFDRLATAAGRIGSELVEPAPGEGGPRQPPGVTERLLSGMHPVQAWRDYRGLTAAAVAARAGISLGYLAQIEAGRRPTTFRITSAIARALNVDLEDLAGAPADGLSAGAPRQTPAA